MNIDNIHPDFKLNGISFARETLKDVAYSFIKEGEPFEMSVGRFLFDWLDGSPSVEVQTSGSTGTPKQIVLQKQQMVNSALTTGNFFDLKSGNSALLCLSSDYIAGKMMLVRAMVLGLHLDCVAPTSNPLEGNEKMYDFVAMVPIQLQHSLDKIHQIKTLIVGGASLSFRLKQQLKNAPSHIFETYGMTETITHVAVKEIETGAAVESKYFKVLPNIAFSVDDRNCLVIDAPKVASETVITNDVVNLISETEFEWQGRYDNVINSGGVKLHPERIEEKLASLISQRYFVAGIPDTVLGQKLILLVEGEMDCKKLQEDISNLPSIEKYEIPKKVFMLPSFVVTATGKVNRKETFNLIKF